MEESLLVQPELIGREIELETLKSALNSALAGNGSTVLVSGEAGVGKTRLILELSREAESLGFLRISGWCLADSLEPLMPFRSALRESGLLHLISGDPPPLLVSSYLVDDNGMLIAGSEIESLAMDSHIFSSMLKAVGDFVKDSMGMVGESKDGSGLNVLGYGDYKIIIEQEQGLHLACIIKGGFSEQLVTDMKQMLGEVRIEFGDVLANWDGDMDHVAGIENFVSRLVEGGKYTGKFLVKDPKLNQENLFDNVLQGLQRKSMEQPLLLFMDDLQWSDPTTLRLIHYLARNIKSSRVLIMGAYRPEDMVRSNYGKAHPLETEMQEMSREGLFEQISLCRLDVECTGRMISSVLREEVLEMDFCQMVHSETDGTPLFIMESLKLLADEGFISKNAAGKWVMKDGLEGLELPKKVHDVVKRRLDRLAREQREILECASVIGDEFSTDILAAVVSMGRLPLLKSLAEIESNHRLIHSEKKLYRFDHGNVREVIYDGIMDELREEYHRQVAGMIFKIFPENQVISELAHHYHHANDPRAGKYLLMAGDIARERYSNQEAIRAYRNSIEFIPDDEKPNVMEKLGDVFSLIGNYEQALGMFEKTHDAVADTISKARMLRKMGEIHQNRGEPDLSLNLLERAKDITRGETPEHAKILFAEGCAHHKKGEHETALSLIRESMKFFEMAEDQKGIAEALRYIGSIHWNNGDYREAMVNFERSLDMMQSLKDENGIASALGNMGIVHWNQGHLDDALDCYARSLEITEKVGNRAGTGAILTNMGLVFWDKGELDRSLDFQLRSLRLFEKIGNHNGIATVLGNISLVHRDNGDLGLALEHQKLSLGMRERIGDQSGIALAMQNLGEIYCDLGEFEISMLHYKRSLAICQEIGDRRVSIHNLCGMAEVNLCLGESAIAEEQSKKALEISMAIGAKFEQALSHRMLGITYRDGGQFDEARNEFSRAETILLEIKDKKEMAKLNLEKAILFRLKNDQNEAMKHIESALSDFEKMGMRPCIERCRKELEILNFI